jgi:predicted PurR-regulated permease PerM
MNAPADAAPGERPPRPRSPAALVVLAVLAVAFTLWAAQDLILPVLLAMFLALVGNPIIRGLQRLYLPRFVGALLVLSLGIAGTALLARQLVEPAGEWIREVPREIGGLAPKLRDLAKPVRDANRAAENFARAAGGESTSKPVQVVKTEVNDPYKALTATPRMVASVLAVVLLTFFFMVYGEHLQRKAIALLPDRQQKKVTVEILHAMETEISRYVLTISIINLLLGLVYALCLHFFLAVPLLVCPKLARAKIEGMEGWAKLLE